MEKNEIIDIVEGLKLIEEGVEKIQNIMRDKRFKSLSEMAAQLIPVFKVDDDSLTDSIIKHLE